MAHEELEQIFPGLRNQSYRITGAPTALYNCIAFAAGEMHVRWWPDDPPSIGVYWPPGAPLEESLEAFTAALGTRGYIPCAGPELEEGFEKVALYADASGTPTHAARQLPSGTWASKLGKLEQIEHDTLAAVECPEYGKAVKFLKRPC